MIVQYNTHHEHHPYYRVRSLQLTISQSEEVSFEMEEPTIIPPIFVLSSTSNITVLNPFPITKILFPTATSRQGGWVRNWDNLLTTTQSFLSFRHIISLVPELWSNTYSLPSITAAGPRHPDAMSASACCHVPFDGSYTIAYAQEGMQETLHRMYILPSKTTESSISGTRLGSDWDFQLSVWWS